MNVFLYLVTLIVWGGSWLAIKWQEGSVPIPQSILYRFALASIILMLLLLVFRRLQKIKPRDHLFFFLQAFCLYSLNFMAFYAATTYITSGLVAVIMSTATLFNAVHNRFFWSITPSKGFGIGAPLGIIGLVLLFWGDVASGEWSSNTLTGIGFALLGTWFFSLGNMIGVRNGRRGIETLTSTAWGMIYGCVILGIIISFSGTGLAWDNSDRYLMGLVYLAIFASVIGFTVYLMLVARIGANNASYALVVTPVIALGLSTVFENYQWTTVGFIGLAFIVMGNIIVLNKK